MLYRLLSILRTGEQWPGRAVQTVAPMTSRPDRLWRKRPARSSADYFVFLGESGAVTPLTDQPAVFVQVCCLVERVAYRRDIVPALEYAKQRWFGRTDVPLHPGVFGAAMHPCLPLASIAARRAFAAEFDALLTRLPFRLFAVAVQSSARWRNTERAEHVYDATVPVWLPRLCQLPKQSDQPLARSLTFLAESRNEDDDTALWLRFRAGRQVLEQVPYVPELWFERSAPSATHAGFDLARMTAPPIARHVFRVKPRIDRAFECLRSKFLGSYEGRTAEHGICRIRR